MYFLKFSIRDKFEILKKDVRPNELTLDKFGLQFRHFELLILKVTWMGPRGSRPRRQFNDLRPSPQPTTLPLPSNLAVCVSCASGWCHGGWRPCEWVCGGYCVKTRRGWRWCMIVCARLVVLVSVVVRGWCLGV